MSRLAPMAAGALLAASLCCEAAGPYTIQDLGFVPKGGLINGHAFNSSNQVTGELDNPPGQPSTQAFLWSAGSLLNLGPVAGTSWDGQYGAGMGINDAGEVVGTAETASDGGHGFLYQNGTFIDLGTLGGGGSSASGVSCGGLIVGQAGTASGDLHAFLYENGAMHEIGTPVGTNSNAFAINSAGQVVGFVDTGTGSNAFLYSAGAMQDLGVLAGGTWTEATAINAFGDVAGMGDTATPNVYHAFLYSHGVMQDLGAPPGTMPSQVIFPRTGVDSADDVVWSVGAFPIANNPNTTEHGFIYSQGQGWTDLNTLLDPSDPLAPYAVISDATAINDAGVILASGFDKRSIPGAQHTYLLTPAVPPAPSSAPNPCVTSSGSSSSSSSSNTSSSSSSASASASSSSSASVGPTANSQAVYPTSSGSTGGGGGFDAFTLALLAGGVLRAIVLKRARRTPV